MKIINNNQKCSIIDISADDLAAQLTLIDLPIFKRIKRDELIAYQSLSRTSKHLNQCPNVLAMNRQFNQVTYWVVGQILSHESARFRAEIISYFIKTAKRLNQLNNLHSSYAIVSALLSTPIYRLEKSWLILKRKFLKDKLQLNQLIDFYSDNNNYELLRKHLNNCQLPCIPYLGLYSRDIIYINVAYQQQRQHNNNQHHSTANTCDTNTIKKDLCTNNILNSIEKFQSSEYEQLVFIPTINYCLQANRYLDELQKFVEDENYRRSLQLEPAGDLNGHNNNNQQQQSINNHLSNKLDSHTSAGSHSNCKSSSATLDQSSASSRTGGTQRRPAMLLASLTSMVHSAMLTTSSKFASSSPRRSSSDSQKHNKYLIDDSRFILTNNTSASKHSGENQGHQTIVPPPISTSS